MAGNLNLPTENIDDVILGLLALEPNEVAEIDYQSYRQYLKEVLIEISKGKKISGFETDLLKNEFKRIRNKKGRFRIKVKKISASSFGLGSITKKIKGTQQRFLLLPADKINTNTKEKVETISDKKSIKKDPLLSIDETLGSILETLTSIYKDNLKKSEKSRRDVENIKREDRESELESKTFDGIKKVASTILKPFESIWSRLLKFITNILLGRAFIKLIGWIGDPKNQGKIQSVIRFFSDHWPTLLALYLRFGTGIGRFVGKLGGILVKGAFKLGALATRLALKAGIGKAGGKLSKVAGFLGGPRGKLLSAGIGIAADVAVTAGTATVIDKFTGGDSPTQKFYGGGAVRVPKFAGGGFANFGKILGGAGLGSMFGPLGMMLGAGIGSLSSGLVSGPKGRDRVPAMLTDGEFVMSVGAVNKYGVETLEAMNASGGGTNEPKVVGSKTYAAGGGVISKNIGGPKYLPGHDIGSDIKNIKDFIKNKIGYDVDKPQTWKLSTSNISNQSSLSTGSLLTNPIGAISRIATRSGVKIPNLSSGKAQSASTGSLLTNPIGAISRIATRSGIKVPQIPKQTSSKSTGFFGEIAEKMQGSGAATYRDAGSIYAKQMLGGYGGPISEQDLSKDSRNELIRAIERAKKRTGTEIAKAEAKIKELEASGASKTPKGKEALATQRSFLNKLKSGGIRVQYTDYADEKGKMSESAENAKNILGQFWATERSKKEGGGYRIEDKYDFDSFKKKVKDPKTGEMIERDLDSGELIRDVILGKGKTTQQRLQAAHLLNPFKGKGDVDMVLGGKRTILENLGLAGSKTLVGGLLGISGKPKDKNQIALEANRPWWDKMGWFGGTSAQIKKNQESRKNFSKNNPAARLYNKSQKNTGESYKSKFARPRNDKVKPVKPPSRLSRSSPKTYRGGQRGSGANPNHQRPRSQNPTHSSRSTRTARSTLGINK